MRTENLLRQRRPTIVQSFFIKNLELTVHARIKLIFLTVYTQSASRKLSKEVIFVIQFYDYKIALTMVKAISAEFET